MVVVVVIREKSHYLSHVKACSHTTDLQHFVMRRLRDGREGRQGGYTSVYCVHVCGECPEYLDSYRQHEICLSLRMRLQGVPALLLFSNSLSINLPARACTVKQDEIEGKIQEKKTCPQRILPPPYREMFMITMPCMPSRFISFPSKVRVTGAYKSYRQTSESTTFLL